MNRKEILEAFKDKPVALPLVEDLFFLDDKIDELKKLPFIRVHPNNPAMQKPTEASKQCREFIALRCTIARTLAGMMTSNGNGNEGGLGDEDRKRIRSAMLALASSDVKPTNVRKVTRYDMDE